jgi:hypothetical protein
MRRPAFVAQALLVVVALVAWLLASSAHAQTLGANTNFAAGTNPIGIAVGDVNRDGRPDLVVTNGTPGTISVLLATGDGTFGAPSSFTVGTQPVAVALGDLNRDGILDAVVANAAGNSISIMIGNATGGFGGRVDVPVGLQPTAVAIGDLDSDGRLDVVVTNGVAGTVSVLRGNGAGALSLVGDFATGPFPSSVVLADVNADSLLDVIVGSRDGGIVSVFVGVGGGLLGPRVDLDAGSSIVGVAVGDFNGDGRPDLVAADSILGPFAVQLADPLGGFRRTATTFTIGQGLAAVVVADFDGNGRVDLVLAFASGTTFLLGGKGGSDFTVGSSQAIALTTSTVAVGDFDRDGLPDLVAVHPAGNVVSVRLNTTVPAGAGSFVATPPTPSQPSPSDAQPVAIFLADLASFNSAVPRFDGFVDAVAVDTDEVNVGAGTTLGVFPPFSTGGVTVAAALADVNRDGRPDLLLAQTSGRVKVRLGTDRGVNGKDLGGTFGPPIETNISLIPIAIAVGDLDRDGVADLVVAAAAFESVVTLRGLGNGAFTPLRSLNLPQGSIPSALALADLNRDGALDVIIAHANGISIFPGDGAGAFDDRFDAVIGLSPLGLAVGDVNRDGRLDLAFTSASDGLVRVVLGTGTGTFNALLAFSGFTAPSVLALADLTRDGVVDLVVLDGGAGTLVVRPGLGNGNFGAPTTAPAGPNPAVFAIEDVNKDGLLDLAVLSSDRQMRVLLNDGTGSGTIAFADFPLPTLVESSGTSLNVLVTRTGGTAPATVDLTLSGTAVPGVDYELVPDGEFSSLPVSSTLTFAQGEASRRLTLRVGNSFFGGDALVSANKSIVLTLSNPGGGAVLGTPSQQTTTLTERDEALSFIQPIFQVTEGGQAVVTVRRRGDLQGTVTVGFKTIGGSAAAADFVAAVGTLTFPPGVAQQTFVVKVNADAAREADEAIAVQLTAPTSTVGRRVIQLESPSVAEILVLDGNAASVAFAGATASVAEGTSTTLTLTRTGALTETATAVVTVTPLSATAADFTLTPPAPATIVFAPGVTTQTIQVAATADATAEGPESIRLQITSVTSGARPGRIGTTSAVLLTIVDDDSALGFTDAFADRQLPESTPTATFTVMRTGSLTTTATVQARTVEGAGGGTAVPGVDYQPVPPTTLTFPPGMATRTFTVPLLNDTLVDGARTLRVALASPAGGPALGTQNTSTVTLLDDDDGGLIQWQKASATVGEGVGNAVLMVTRTVATPGKKLASGVTVNVARTNGTATPSSDFTAPASSLTFAAGQASQTVTVPIVADQIDEDAETVVFALSNPQGGAVLGPLATFTLTITDDDAGGQIQFALASATVDEDNPATVNVRLTRTGNNPAAGVTVDLAVTGGTAQQGVDFNLPTGTLTFAAGETTKDLALARFSDGRPEGPETISLALSNPTGGATLGAQRTMLITILGAESAVGFSQPAFSVNEGTAMATLTVTRTGPLTSAATVQVRTLDLAGGGGGVAVPGIDYLPLPPTILSFPPGMASRPVAVPILNNTRRDGARTVALALSNPSAGLALGTQQTTVLAIADNDAPGTVGFSADSVTVSDTAAVATLTVTRTGTGLAGGVSVDFVADFFDGFFGTTRRQTGIVVFGPGQTSRTIALALNTDPLVRNERAFVQLTNLTGGATLGRSRMSVTVTDKDAGGTLRFTTSAVTAVEGSTLLLTVARTGGSAGGVGVPFSITDGSVGGFSARRDLDFVLPSGILFFDEGEMSQSIVIPILADALLEGPESFQVSIGNPTGGGVRGTPSSVLVTIVDTDAAVGFARGFVSVDEPTTAVTVTVLRSGPLTGTATVQFRTVEGAGSGNAVADVDYRPIQKTLTFGPGVASQTVTVSLLNDNTVDGQRTVRLDLSNPTGMALGTGQRTMNININDNDFGGSIRFAASQFIASETAGVATLRLVRSLPSVLGVTSPTLGGGVVVSFVVTAQTASPGSDFTVGAGTVTFGAGETVKDIVIPLGTDGLLEGPESFLVTLQSATGGAFVSRDPATVTIVD